MNQSNKEKYEKLCVSGYNIPVFIQYWWMNAVCENNWDVIICESKDTIQGVLVYHLKEKNGFKAVIQPMLTQTSGIWLNYPKNYNETAKRKFEKEVCFKLIDELEKNDYSYFDQNFNHEYTNWLPFYWKGYQQTTRYTYQIRDLSNLDNCFNAFSYAKKKQINKSASVLHLNSDISPDDFYNMVEMNIQQRNETMLYSKDFFVRVYEACAEKNQGKLIAVQDENGNNHAALFIIWDEMATYNLVSAILPEYKSSGGSSLVVWEAIKEAANHSGIFDFEGSMNENIENSFSQFGTTQVPYFRIFKHNSLLFQMLLNLKKWR